MTAPFFVCRVGSSHFDFEAYGATRQGALDAFAAGIRQHCQNNPGATEEWAASMLEDANPQPVVLGGCYCDGTVLTITPQATLATPQT